MKQYLSDRSAILTRKGYVSLKHLTNGDEVAIVGEDGILKGFTKNFMVTFLPHLQTIIRITFKDG